MKKEMWVWIFVCGAAFTLVGCQEEDAPDTPADTTAEMTMEAEAPAGEVMTPEVAVGEDMGEDASSDDEPVVTVDGEVLTRADFNMQMQQVLQNPQFAALPEEQAAMVMQQMQGQIVNQFIDQTLLRNAADGADIEVTEEEVDAYLDELREYFGEGESLEARMSMQGITMDELRRDIVADMKIRSLLDDMTESIAAADDEEIRAYYEENSEMFSVPESVTASHILIELDPDADEEAREAAREQLAGIREEIVAGEKTFEEAASEHSSCPSSERGGELGQFARGQMVPEFEDAAFAQEVGTVGDIVETDFGLHLILVSERADATEQDFEDVRDDIAEELLMEQKQAVVQEYLETLRSEADIEYAE